MPLPEPATLTFEAERKRLLRLAYRMLGEFGEAEDVVQDAWLRWDRRAEEPANPAGYLTRIVTHLCLDRIGSARARRETYFGTWLPEPLIETEAEQGDAELADDLTLTLMLALERLSPLERAAFLLHDIFEMPLGEVATTLERDPAAARQLASRARKHVQASRPRFPVDRAQADRIAGAFFAASKAGDTEALRTLLAEDVVLHSDGGGKVLAFRNVIDGIDRTLRLFAGLARKWGRDRDALVRSLWIDGLPGYVSIERGAILQTTALNIEDGRVRAIYIVRNPDKLAHVARLVEADSDRATSH